MCYIHEKGAFTLTDILDELRKNSQFSKVGAIATFTGVVREITARKEKVSELELEAYEEKANEALATICEELRKEPDIIDVQIHHLLGSFKVGEDIVYVVVAGSHRKNVFRILEEAVDRYKSEAPIFKKEIVATKGGKKKAYWISESQSEANH